MWHNSTGPSHVDPRALSKPPYGFNTLPFLPSPFVSRETRRKTAGERKISKAPWQFVPPFHDSQWTKTHRNLQASLGESLWPHSLPRTRMASLQLMDRTVIYCLDARIATPTSIPTASSTSGPGPALSVEPLMGSPLAPLLVTRILSLVRRWCPRLLILSCLVSDLIFCVLYFVLMLENSWQKMREFLFSVQCCIGINGFLSQLLNDTVLISLLLFMFSKHRKIPLSCYLFTLMLLMLMLIYAVLA